MYWKWYIPPNNEWNLEDWSKTNESWLIDFVRLSLVYSLPSQLGWKDLDSIRETRAIYVDRGLHPSKRQTDSVYNNLYWRFKVTMISEVRERFPSVWDLEQRSYTFHKTVESLNLQRIFLCVLSTFIGPSGTNSSVFYTG